MASAKQSSVVKRKLQRKQALFLKHEPNSGIRFQEEPSCHIFIANGGLQNGLSRDLLKHFVTEPLLCGSGDLKQLYLPAGEDYAFATFASPKAASEAITGLNGSCIQEMSRSGPDNLLRLLNPKLLSGPPLHLYLCFVDRIPLSCTYSEPCSTELPPGLTLIEEFVSVEEEELLLDFFGMPTHASFSDHMHSKCTSKPLMQESACHGDRETSVRFSAPENVLRHRHVKHYGYEFLYHSSNVDPETPLPGGLPDACKPLLKRMMERKLVETEPDQLTVNYYLPGAGIPPHVDTHSAFEGSIISLSLGCHVVMDFRHPDGRKIPVFLQRRSLLVMSGEARYLWTHGIAARQFDEVYSEMAGSTASIQSYEPGQTSQSRATTSTVLPRGIRTSLTFRKVRRIPCICGCDYPSLCDSKQKTRGEAGGVMA